jgi:hypothetical protein
MPRTITSLEGYVRKISEIQPKPDEVLLYRGHPRKEFKLLPSVLRDPKFQEAEHAILRELVASHPADFASDSRAQAVRHHSCWSYLQSLGENWRDGSTAGRTDRNSSGRRRVAAGAARRMKWAQNEPVQVLCGDLG